MAEPLEVKPCPLCGTQPNVGQVMAAGLMWWDVQCPSCSLRLSNDVSGEAVRAAWNTRAPDQMAGVDGEVMQADRDAARPFMDRYLDGSQFAEDRNDLAQAFARHRQSGVAAGLEQAATIAEGFTDPNRDWLDRSVWDGIKRDTAVRIRAAIWREQHP